MKIFSPPDASAFDAPPIPERVIPFAGNRTGNRGSSRGGSLAGSLGSGSLAGLGGGAGRIKAKDLFQQQKEQAEREAKSEVLQQLINAIRSNKKWFGIMKDLRALDLSEPVSNSLEDGIPREKSYGSKTNVSSFANSLETKHQKEKPYGAKIKIGSSTNFLDNGNSREESYGFKTTITPSKSYNLSNNENGVTIIKIHSPKSLPLTEVPFYQRAGEVAMELTDSIASKVYEIKEGVLVLFSIKKQKVVIFKYEKGGKTIETRAYDRNGQLVE